MPLDLLNGPLYVGLLFCLPVSAPVAIGIAWLVLRRYQAVLLRVMNQASVQAVAAPAPVQCSLPVSPRSALRIEFIDPTSTPPLLGQTSALTQRGNRFRYRLALAHAAGGAGQSIIITLLWFLFAQSTLSPRVFLALWLIFAWPITRAVTKERKGCTEEVRQLCNRIDLHHVVFIVNEETDMLLLRNTMQETWQAVAAGSPNLRSASPIARLIRLEDHGTAGVRFLLQTLYAATRMHLVIE
jgi:hypothetical protein